MVAFAPLGFADDGERISQLEREVAELKRIVNRLVDENQELKTTVAEVSEGAGTSAGAFSSVKSAFSTPKLSIHGFGHIQYDYSQADNSDATSSDTNAFKNGGVDLVITSQISDKISFLNETLFEFGEDGANILDVERVLLKYAVNDRFNIAAGRGHTALGYWNQQFHHGTWLQTTADRPIIYRFEDDGGILPVHYVGLEFSGNIENDGGTLAYVANIANGRGTIVDEVQLIEDDNDSKMFSLMLSYEPESIEGFGFGVNVLHDIIPSKLGTTNRGAEIDELIYGGHLYYTASPYEVIVEVQVIDHYNHATNLDDTVFGGYVQLAYQVDDYKPYFRFDWLSIADRDPFFAGSVPDETSYTTGLRYELTSYAALKFEYRYVDTDEAKKNELTIQSSFVF